MLPWQGLGEAARSWFVALFHEKPVVDRRRAGFGTRLRFGESCREEPTGDAGLPGSSMKAALERGVDAELTGPLGSRPVTWAGVSTTSRVAATAPRPLRDATLPVGLHLDGFNLPISQWTPPRFVHTATPPRSSGWSGTDPPSGTGH